MPSTMGFIEYLDSPSLQSAIQQARVAQQRNRLAVLPKADLAPIVAAGLQREGQGQRLSLGERRLDLARQIQRDERKHLPVSIGLGAAELGVNVLGGLRGLQLQKQDTARRQRLETLAETALEERRQQNRRVLDLLATQQGKAAGLYPVAPQPFIGVGGP